MLPELSELAPVSDHCHGLLERLDSASQRLVCQAQQAAETHRVRLCMVGGLVRDLLLHRTSDDLDFLVEGTAQAVESFISALEHTLQATRLDHERFGTSTLTLPSGRHLDIALARREHYPHPAALPVVEPTTLALDLCRRDFTINSMALCLAGEQAGQLLDPTGGQVDLAGGWVRILHPHSFEDDPTRIFRAVRFAARLGFRLEQETARLARQALHAGMVERLSNERVAYELERLLGEPTAPEALALLGELDGLAAVRLPRALGPHWELLRRDEAGWQSSAQPLLSLELPVPTSFQMQLLVLGLALQPVEQGPFLARLAIRGVQAERLRQVWQLLPASLATLKLHYKPSLRVEQLERMPTEGWWLLHFLLTATALAPVFVSGVTEAECLLSRDVLWRFLAHERRVKSPLNGHSLQQLGVKPGPSLKRWLERLRERALDEGLTPAEAETWVKLRADLALEQP